MGCAVGPQDPWELLRQGTLSVNHLFLQQLKDRFVCRFCQVISLRVCDGREVCADIPIITEALETLVSNLRQCSLSVMTRGALNRHMIDFHTKWLAFFHVVLTRGSASIHFIK